MKDSRIGPECGKEDRKNRGSRAIVEYIRHQLGQGAPDAFFAVGARPPAPSCAPPRNAFVPRISWESAQAHKQGFRKRPHFPLFFAAIGPFVKEIEEMRRYSPTPPAWTPGRRLSS